MENNNYCPLIFHGIYAERSLNGKLSISPCCLATQSAADLIDFDGNTYLSSLRTENKSNLRSTACKPCWDLEDKGGESKRKVTINWYTDNNIIQDYLIKLYHVDYNTLPICNAKCVICSPKYSSTWASVSPNDRILKDLSKFDHKHLDLIDFDDVKQLYFNGGEPLLTNEHYLVLKKINNLAAVDIMYNTNGSCYPSTKVLELWKIAKSVTIFFSIDGVGQRFEETRTPLKWDKVSANIEKINNLSYVDVQCSYTIGKHNVYDLEDTVNWFAKLSNFNTLEKFHVHYVNPDHALYFNTASADELSGFKKELSKFNNYHWYLSIYNSMTV
jgi:sulfatase maturation enzyme AslB (radical SAM superfamily)